jgi:hypothetical protein
MGFAYMYFDGKAKTWDLLTRFFVQREMTAQA